MKVCVLMFVLMLSTSALAQQRPAYQLEQPTPCIRHLIDKNNQKRLCENRRMLLDDRLKLTHRLVIELQRENLGLKKMNARHQNRWRPKQWVKLTTFVLSCSITALSTVDSGATYTTAVVGSVCVGSGLVLFWF